MGKEKTQAKESPSDAALSRVRAICYGFPGVEEKLSHGAPSFFVRGKMFLGFVDDHHADGRLAVWCKCTFDRQRALVAAAPDRYFVPPYVGVKGWLGARLDRPTTDWVELAIIVEEGWLSLAPPKLARGEGVKPGPRPPPPPRVTTDEKTARESLERLTKICLALPETTRERESSHASFLVAEKTFVYFLDNHHGDGMIVACVRNDKGENAKLVKKDPRRYCSPAYIGPRGWLGVRLDAPRVDWKEIAARVTQSYRAVAPKKILAAHAARGAR
ncbi:MAG: MmcQ/YjbR family DNA-binding protein [Polyangiaceae bacterium]